ncbi:MAG TPA: hypothetical protein VFK80_06525 [Limnochordia bacterium]|nr:hypothetical protein [Limnochordia bacterium]
MQPSARTHWRTLAIGVACALAIWYFAGAIWQIAFPFVTRTQPAERGELSDQLEGAALFYRPSDWVVAPVAGRVTTLVSEGTSVAAGALVAEIDPAPAAAAPLSAETATQRKLAVQKLSDLQSRIDLLQGEIASQEIERQDAVAREKLSTAKQIDEKITQLKAELAPNLAERRRLQAQLGDADEAVKPVLVTAQGAGLVTFKSGYGWATAEDAFAALGDDVMHYRPAAEAIGDGSLVAQGQPLYGLARSGEGRLYLVAPGLHVPALHQKVTLHFGGAVVRAQIAAVFPKLERSVLVLNLAEEADWAPGLRGRAEVRFDSVAGVLLSRRALTKKDGVEGVYVMVERRPVFRPVEVKAGSGDRIVVDGVPVGARVVVDPAAITS